MNSGATNILRHKVLNHRDEVVHHETKEMPQVALVPKSLEQEVQRKELARNQFQKEAEASLDDLSGVEEVDL